MRVHGIDTETGAHGDGWVTLDRGEDGAEDVARWIDGLATAGQLSWRSVQIYRNVLRASLADAVEEGLIRRSPAARVPMPRVVSKPPKVKETEEWTDDEVTRFLEATVDHRFATRSQSPAVSTSTRRSPLAIDR